MSTVEPTVGLNVPEYLLPTIYRALHTAWEATDAQPFASATEQLRTLERDQADCRERGDCPACGASAGEVERWARELKRFQGIVHETIAVLNNERAAMRRLEQASVANEAAVAAVRGLLRSWEASGDSTLADMAADLSEALSAPF